MTDSEGSAAQSVGYAERFANDFVLTRRDGILEVRTGTSKTSATWSRRFLHSWIELLRMVAADDLTEVLILTGSGDQWIGGVDPDSFATPMTQWPADAVYQQFTDGCQLLESIVALRVPTIAAINGPGPRLESALLCDLTVCSADTTFGDGNFGAGSTPGDGMQLILAEAVGARRAAAMVYLGDRLSAPEALALGLVNEVLSTADEVRARAWAMAEQLMAQPRMSRRVAHELVAEPWRSLVSGRLRGAYARQLMVALSEG